MYISKKDYFFIKNKSYNLLQPISFYMIVYRIKFNNNEYFINKKEKLM